MNYWHDFLYHTKLTTKVGLILLGIAVFVAIASACSPVFAFFDEVTGYGI